MRAKRWWEPCQKCRLAFSRVMLRWHLEHDHAILKCRLCGKPIYVFGIAMTLSPPRSEFCTQACKRAAEAKGLCLSCLKPPDDTFRGGRCSECRRKYRLIRDDIRRVNGELRSIWESRYTPYVYQRPFRRSAGSERIGG